jgi:hypothetical protein
MSWILGISMPSLIRGPPFSGASLIGRLTMFRSPLFEQSRPSPSKAMYSLLRDGAKPYKVYRMGTGLEKSSRASRFARFHALPSIDAAFKDGGLA